MCKNKPIDCNFTSDIDLNSPKACSSSNDMNFYTLSQVTDFVTFHNIQQRYTYISKTFD